jgi:hypothetical protein
MMNFQNSLMENALLAMKRLNPLILRWDGVNNS